MTAGYLVIISGFTTHVLEMGTCSRSARMLFSCQVIFLWQISFTIMIRLFAELFEK